MLFSSPRNNFCWICLAISICLPACSTPANHPSTTPKTSHETKTRWHQRRAENRERWQSENRRPMRLDAATYSYTKKATNALKVAVLSYYKQHMAWPKRLQDVASTLEDTSIYQHCRFTIKHDNSFLAEYQLKGVEGEMGFGYTLKPKP